MALQRTRRPRLRSGRSLCSLGSPLNAQPLGSQLDISVGRRALPLALFFLMILGYSFGRADDQAPPPSGTRWKAIPEIKANLALPNGWQFRKLPSTPKILIYEIVPRGPGIPTHSRSKYELKVEKDVPRAIVVFKARNYVEAIRAQAVESEPVEEQTKGVMNLFVSVAHLEPDASGAPQLTVALAAIANSRTGTLYTMRFDIPAAELEAVETLANQLFRHIRVDDEI